MTALPQSTRRKLSLLDLAEELGNVSKACRIMGYHRDSFNARRAFPGRRHRRAGRAAARAAWPAPEPGVAGDRGRDLAVRAASVLEHRVRSPSRCA